MTLATAQTSKAILTVDLEDYRDHQLSDLSGLSQQGYPEEVTKQTSMLLDIFERLSCRATFFTVAKTAESLPKSLVERIAREHHVGCHGYNHDFVYTLGKDRFREDITRAKRSLETIFGVEILSYRAPYFSCDGCSPWFGEVLGDVGFKVDSSIRLNKLNPDTEKTFALEGSNGRVLEFPLYCSGVGPKRLTVIGGTYFRILPFSVILKLMRRAEKRGFFPIIYLHPYDIDPTARRLEDSGKRSLRSRLGEEVRRIGRASVGEKLNALAKHFSFVAMDDIPVMTSKKSESVHPHPLCQSSQVES
jgi:polysaccharide deacetylase family protein (PEP-CTERM system associated)